MMTDNDQQASDQENQDVDQNNSDPGKDDPSLPVIALYYCYTPRPIPSVLLANHVKYHTDLCTALGLKGRIRVSSEGINGVLSGRKSVLLEYEQSLHSELTRILNENEEEEEEEEDDSNSNNDSPLDLDVKYCQLRPDIPTERQLFHSLSVKQTREVVSLYESKCEALQGSNRRGGRRGRRWKKKQQEQQKQQEKEDKSEEEQGKNHSQPDGASNDDEDTKQISIPTSPEDIDLKLYPPAPHLSPQEWNQQLEKETEGDAILLDARNVYESRVGHFTVPGVPTILPNTRKYSSLPAVIDASSEQLAGKKVYMYCTGGVRCERASAYLQALADSERWKGEMPKEVYQLKGGIQRYLEAYGTSVQDEKAEESSSSSNKDACLYKGRNFVFDLRRTDPVVGPDSPGRCLLCHVPHDDYDNGHAPCENMEARCCRCRVLVLVCNECRSKVRIWGEEVETCSDGESDTHKPDLFCGPGGKECVDEGNNVSMEIISSS